MPGRFLTRVAVAAGVAGSVLIAVAHPGIALGGRATAPQYGPYSPAVYGPTTGSDAVSLYAPTETGSQGRKVQ